MARNAENLASAKKAKNDEFYTQWADIEREVNAYLEYDPDVFRGKTILLPCDDPEWSNFTKLFALHFVEYGIEKLVSTSYAADSNPANVYTLTPFEANDPVFDKAKTRANGKVFTLELHDLTGDGVVNIDDLKFDYLEGDGDFRSAEVTQLRDEADIIITNPPFSLFREFVAWIIEGKKKFTVVGNLNATTYKDVFDYIRDGEMWWGTKSSSKQMFLGAPDWYTEKVRATKPRGSWWTELDGKTVVGINNAIWFTNIDHGRRHEPLQLMSMEDNVKHSRHKEIRGRGYAHYDNYDAIEVKYFDAIPNDFDDLMGVSITFLDKFDPDQFEIVGITKTWDDSAGLKRKVYGTQIQVSKDGTRSRVGKLNDGAAIVVEEAPGSTYYIVDNRMYIQPYARLLIRHKR